MMQASKWIILGVLILASTIGVGVGSGVWSVDDIPTLKMVSNWINPDLSSGTKNDLVENKSPAVSVDKIKVEPEAKPKIIAQPIVPAFDILRVEKTGDVLVAGRAGPNSSVELLSPSGDVLGRSKTGAIGDFVIILDRPLPPGDYQLVLRATSPDGAVVLSAETGLVHIPELSGGEVLAMVSEDGKASRILTAPKMVKEQVPVAAVQEPVVEQKADPIEKLPIVENVENKDETENVKTAALKVDENLPDEKIDDLQKAPVITPVVISSSEITVEAVEIENGNIYVAGAVKQGEPVRVYIDNKPLGVTRGTSDNRFLLKRKFNLEEGQHSVRADVVGSVDGKVKARAEVPLIHQVPGTVPKVVVAAKTGAIADTENLVLENAQSVIRTGSTIIIKPGDNLWRISRKTYGRGIRYTTIYNANRDQIRDPSRIYIGQIFKLPSSADPAVSENLQ